MANKTSVYGGDEELDEKPVDDPVIDTSGDDEEELDAATPAGPSRDEKRRNRQWMNREEKASLMRELEETKQRAEQAILGAQQATLYAQKMAGSGQQQQQRDPLDDADAQLDKERQLLNDRYQFAYAGGKRPSPEEQRAFETEAKLLERRTTQIEVSRQMRYMQQPQQNTAAEVFKANLRQRYPEATSNPQAMAYAEGQQKMLQAQGHDPWAPATVDIAMKAAERAFRIGSHKQGASRAPDPSMRDRLSGSRPGAGGGGSGEASSDGKMVMTKENRKLANAAYSHIKDETTRWKTWARAQSSDD